MDNEIWLNVNNEYHDYYMVSNFGRVKRLRRKIIKKMGKTTQIFWLKEKIATIKFGGRYEYPTVFLKCKSVSKKTKLYNVHRLIMITFHPIENMEKMQVNHIDGNKENNHLDNLEWTTPKENIQHAIKLGLYRPNGQNGERNHRHKLTEEQVLKIVELSKTTNLMYTEIAKEFNVDPQTISDIVHGRRWGWLTKIQKISK